MRTIRWAVLLAFLSCTSSSKSPEDLMSKETMAAILTDIHLAEARITKMNLRSMDSSVVIFNKLQQDIWDKHNTDSSYYRKSYAYYASNPEKLSEVYEIVGKYLENADSISVTVGK